MKSLEARNLEALLQVGAIVVVHSEHPDSAEDYEFRLLADGARALDCVPPDLPSEAFRAVFSDEALATGDALLAVAQSNSTARHGDEEYGGEARPRTYTYRATTPPFLLSESLDARVRGREPIQLHFYDYLDEGCPLELAFVSTGRAEILVDREPHEVDVVRYEGGGMSLEVADGSRFVLSISRDDAEFEMRVVVIRTRAGT